MRFSLADIATARVEMLFEDVIAETVDPGIELAFLNGARLRIDRAERACEFSLALVEPKASPGRLVALRLLVQIGWTFRAGGGLGVCLRSIEIGGLPPLTEGRHGGYELDAKVIELVGAVGCLREYGGNALPFWEFVVDVGRRQDALRVEPFQLPLDLLVACPLVVLLD